MKASDGHEIEKKVTGHAEDTVSLVFFLGRGESGTSVPRASPFSQQIRSKYDFDPFPQKVNPDQPVALPGLVF
jgi:hypothetical protein